MFFFFKQKTAYEMRISDWSSDVCSSDLTALSLRGTISWPGFGKHGEDWLGFVFVVTAFTGTPLQRNPEGTLEWVAIDRLHELPMWEGDREFLPLVFDDDPR